MGRTESKGNAAGLGFRAASAKESDTPLPRMAGRFIEIDMRLAEAVLVGHSGCDRSFTEASVLGAERGYHVQKPSWLVCCGYYSGYGYYAGRQASERGSFCGGWNGKNKNWIP